MREAGDEGGLDQAIFRLERAVNQLEHRVGALVAQAEGANGGLFDQDRSKLADELDAARSRERELEQAGALASRALDRAIIDIRAALGEDRAGEEA